MTKRACVVLVLMLLAGCAASSSQKVAATRAEGAPHAECLVCKYNADLACVDVAVENDTPRCVCEGKTYYFCSTECEQKFAKNPAKYLSTKH